MESSGDDLWELQYARDTCDFDSSSAQDASPNSPRRSNGCTSGCKGAGEKFHESMECSAAAHFARPECAQLPPIDQSSSLLNADTLNRKKRKQGMHGNQASLRHHASCHGVAVCLTKFAGSQEGPRCPNLQVEPQGSAPGRRGLPLYPHMPKM